MGRGVVWIDFSLRKLLIRNMQAMLTSQDLVCRKLQPGKTRVFDQPLATMEVNMIKDVTRRLWLQDEGQDIAEYAVMLAVILVIVVGTIRLIGGNANNVFSSVASSIAQ